MKHEPYKEERPWGNFVRFTHNELSTVKILTVRAGEELSLQRHKKREEFWRVLKGTGEVVVGDESLSASPGDEFTIKMGALHTIKAGVDMEVLEISFGQFDESDIERISDKYKRDVSE
jgi:mannose-1-phosphate guanylyltransferase/mannose-1-phosphate guanylyltransferase/mannose-6-phosphate isomerase